MLFLPLCSELFLWACFIAAAAAAVLLEQHSIPLFVVVSLFLKKCFCFFSHNFSYRSCLASEMVVMLSTASLPFSFAKVEVTVSSCCRFTCRSVT